MAAYGAKDTLEKIMGWFFTLGWKNNLVVVGLRVGWFFRGWSAFPRVELVVLKVVLKVVPWATVRAFVNVLRVLCDFVSAKLRPKNSFWKTLWNKSALACGLL